MTTSCIVLGHYSYVKPFCIYTISSNIWFCLEDLNFLFFHQLNIKATLKKLFKANPHHFSKANDGRTFMMTSSVIQVARCFNYFYLAELCKLTVDEIMGKVADPLLKCIDHDSWHIAPPCLNNLELNFEPLTGNEDFFSSCCGETESRTEEKEYMSSRMSIEEQGKKQYRPITTTTIQLSTILHRWLSTDVSEYPPGSSIYQTLQSVEKTKREQQAIIETRQLQAVYIAPTTKVTRFIKDKLIAFPDIKRKRGDYLHCNKRPKLDEKRTLPLPSQQEHNLHLLASQATQMRGLPISPSLSPPTTPFLLQPMNNTKQPLRLPSIRAMLSDLPIQMDYFA
ncbi:unnamed protein product [Rhizopus stolonifer]